MLRNVHVTCTWSSPGASTYVAAIWSGVGKSGRRASSSGSGTAEVTFSESSSASSPVQRIAATPPPAPSASTVQVSNFAVRPVR
jgi:hypothetical protein